MEPAYRHSARPTNLPAATSTFIGRTRETAEVTRLLAESRLLTLTGPGGSGKTRLALHVAGGLEGYFPDSIWLVELAPIRDRALVTQAVADVLNVRDRAGRSFLESLVDFLEPKSVLLVLENCEHLVETCAQLAVTMGQLWGMATTWYASRLQADSRRPKPDEIRGIFSGLGLEDDFWDPESDQYSREMGKSKS